MIRPARATRFAIPLLAAAQLAWSQAAPKTATPDKAGAYYNFSMGHLYSELAAQYGNRAEYVNKAIDHYKQALKLDPAAGFLFEELTDLYVQAGRLKEAVTEAEDMLKQNADNLDARRILGRIYTRLIGDTQQGRINEEMLRRALDQYTKIVEKEPKDLESWLVVGRLQRASRNSVEAEKAYKAALDLESTNEEAMMGLALVYSDVGDNRRAADMLRLVSDKNPNPRTLTALASAYEQMRDYEGAAKALRQALDLQPDNTRVKRALAQSLATIDKLDEALKLYEEIATEEPADAQVHLRIGEIYRQKGDFAKARRSLDRARQLDKDSLEVRYDEVNLLEAEGKTEQAIAVLKAMIDDTARRSYSTGEKGTRSMLLERLGVLYRGANQSENAVAAFRQIAQLDAEFGPRVAVQIVETWRSARDYAKARTESDEAMKKWPKERMVVVTHASLLAEVGKVDEAVAAVRAIAEAGKERETHLAAAQLYEKGKRYAEMGKELDAAEKLSQSSQEKETVAFMRGAMLEKMKKFDAAEAEFRRVLTMNPDNAGALNYLGYMFADRNIKLEEARKMIARALELDPNNGAYLDSLGWVYYRQGQYEEAENFLVRALDRVGKDPTIHDHLGDVYAKLGRTKDAITQWQLALKEWEETAKPEQDAGEMAKIGRKLEDAKVRLAKETARK